MVKKVVLIIVAFVFFFFSGEGYAGEKLRHLSLKECLEMAKENNLFVKEAEEKIFEAEKELLEAKGRFLPVLNAGVSFTRLDREMSPGMGGLIQNLLDEIPGIELPESEYETYTGRDMYSVTGRLRIPLFTGFRNRAVLRNAEIGVEIELENYRKVVNDLYLDVKETFYRVLLTQKIIELNRESELRLEKHLNQTRTLYENGLASRLDLLRSEIQLSNLRSEITRIKNNLRAAKASLLLLMGLKSEDIYIDAKGDLQYTEVRIDLESSVKNALENRPEAVMLRMQKKAAGEGITIARSGGLPQVHAAYNRSLEYPHDMQDKWGSNWNFMINIDLPVFRGFSTHSDTARARSRKKQLEYGIDRLEDGIRLEVENSYYEIINEKENIRALEKNIIQAEEALSIAQRQYRNGIITGLEFRDTELSYMQAHLNLLRAQADYLIAVSRHKHATGGK